MNGKKELKKQKKINKIKIKIKRIKNILIIKHKIELNSLNRENKNMNYLLMIMKIN